MGFLDKLRKKAEDATEKAGDLAEEHSDKIHDGIEKAADFADEKTKGKYTDKIEKAEDAISGAVDKIAGGNTPPVPSNEVDEDDAPDTPPAA